MATKCAWASIDERGRASGGKLGDQTGREVKVGDWYQFGQNVVIRPKDKEKASKLADAMKYLAESNLVGYDQGNRTSLYKRLKNGKFKYRKLKYKTETDCSAMVAACLNVAGYKVSKNAWTGNLVDCCRMAGDFEFLIDNKYIARDAYLRKGDIILNEQSHVIVAIEDGEFAYEKKAGYSGAFPTATINSATGTKANIKRWQGFLKWCGFYDDTIDGSFGPNTIKGTKAFQKANGLAIDGSAGPKTLLVAREYKK